MGGCAVTAGSAAGLFTPAAPQAHEGRVVLSCCCGYNVSRRLGFFGSIIILGDHCRIRGSLLTEMLLCGTGLPSGIEIGTREGKLPCTTTQEHAALA